ncbi:hypothetical protein [Pseudoneobacillus sp. C159]
MTVQLSLNEFLSYIPPKGEYEHFQNESHYAEKLKEWGLSAKKEFWYKDKFQQRMVKIIGYERFGSSAEFNTLVIEFPDGMLSCIHPAYLKEMQASSFGKELTVQLAPETLDNTTEPTMVEENALNDHSTSIENSPEIVVAETKETAKPKAFKGKKESKTKLVLPEDKVHFTGIVKQFALSWNHFNEENDEVVVLDNVVIEGDEPIEVGLAWCAHSKTLKKFELATGNQLEFDGKIVKKSLPKGKNVEDAALLLEDSVPYKINNPSKLVKK